MLKPSAIVLILLFVAGFCFYGFTDGKTCPKCTGAAEVKCTSCYVVAGTCSWCKGSGEDIIFDPNSPCPLCDGTGRCNMCNGTGFRICNSCYGSGWFWTYSVASSTFMFFLAFLLCFLGLFGFEYFVHSLWLYRNPWVRDVREMGFWFNPMYFTWVFYRNRKKWAKWMTPLSLIGALVIVAEFGVVLLSPSYAMARMTPQIFLIGFIFGAMLMVIFAFAWYHDYDRLGKVVH